MLAPAIQRGMVDLWDDTKIPPGAKWRDEIEKGLASANIAVLLVSQNFLASHFISQQELPPLLGAAQAEGVTIFWIYLSSCLYDETEIASYQAAHDTSRPLDRLTKAQRQAVLSEICAKLIKAAGKVGGSIKSVASPVGSKQVESVPEMGVRQAKPVSDIATPSPPAPVTASQTSGSTAVDAFRNTLRLYVAEAPTGFVSLGANEVGKWVPAVQFPDAVRCSGGGPSEYPFIECVLFRSKERAAAEARFAEVIDNVQAALPGWKKSDIGQPGTARLYFCNKSTVGESTVSVDTSILQLGTDYNIYLNVQRLKR